VGEHRDNAGQISDSFLTNVTSDPIPTPEELLEDLRRFVRVGVRPSNLPDIPKLLGLAMVGVAALGTRPVDRALALVEVLRGAVGELGEGPSAESLELLLGLTPRSRGLLLKDRRDLAAEALGVDVETWRRHWERPLLLELATELYRMESEQYVPVRIKPRRGSGAVLHDLSQGSQGKSLDRREAEARLFSIMYALRADLIAVRRLQEESPATEKHAPFVESSLWRFTLFLEAMSRYTLDYGAAIVLAGNEVSVQEAASLLGWRPPLSDEECALLRIIFSSSHERDRRAFIERLTADPRASDLLPKWRLWLENIP
jgi:hypothetical protein